MNTRFSTPAALLTLGLSLYGLACDDPAKGKTKAVTGESAASATLAAQPPAGAVLFEIEPASSKIEWTGSKVSAKHDGGFKQFRGAIAYVEGALEKSTVNVEIDVDSMYVEPERLLKHLKSPDFFDAAKFPKATFASTQVKAGGEKGHVVTGNLSLHGVTKSITFPAKIQSKGGGVDVDAEFSINRKDFGLVYAGAPDDLIRDDVVIRLTVRSQKKS